MGATLKKCKLGDVIELKRGYDLPKKDRIEGSVPIISSSGFSGLHNEAKVKAPGVVTGRYGTLGEVFYIEEDFWPLNTALYVKDFKGNHPRYIKYFLTQLNIAELNAAGAVPGVNRNHLHMLDIEIVEDYENQAKIARVLENYDDLIENNNRRIVILETIAQNLYREWFTNFRFPGHDQSSGQTIGTTEGCPEGASAKDGASKQAQWQETPQGKIPLGWEVKKLSEVAAVNPESITKRNAPSEIHYIDISSVNTGSIAEVKTMNFEDAPSRARRVVRHGDIIWATVRPNRKQFSYIAKPIENTIASTGFAVLRAEKVPASFLYQATTTDSFTAYLVNHATGAAYPAVNASVFQNADVAVPSEKLLAKFDELVGATMQQIEVLKRKNQNLKQQRDMLLPKLI